jgi:hypothetical protein
MQITVPEETLEGFGIDMSELGSPIRLKVSYEFVENKSNFVNIHECEIRPDGTLNDVFLKTIAGMIVSKNETDSLEDVYKVVYEKQIKPVSIRCPKGQWSIDIGDTVALFLSSFHSRKARGIQIASWFPCEGIVSSKAYRFFKIPVVVNNGFGFGKRNIFLSSSVISESRIEDGDMVSFHAHCVYHEKKNKWGWSAFLVDDVRSSL